MEQGTVGQRLQRKHNGWVSHVVGFIRSDWAWPVVYAVCWSLRAVGGKVGRRHFTSGLVIGKKHNGWVSSVGLMGGSHVWVSWVGLMGGSQVCRTWVLPKKTIGFPHSGNTRWHV